MIALHKTTTYIDIHFNVLQDAQRKIKKEAEEYEHTDVKEEQCETYELMPFVNIKKEVKGVSMSLMFQYFLMCSYIVFIIH